MDLIFARTAPPPLTDQVGTTSPAQIALALQLIEELPAAVREALRDPVRAGPVVFALLMSETVSCEINTGNSAGPGEAEQTPAKSQVHLPRLRETAAWHWPPVHPRRLDRAADAKIDSLRLPRGSRA